MTELTTSLSCLRKDGFRLVEQSESHEREINSFVGFENENVRVRFICDHQHVFGELGAKGCPGTWHLFESVAELIGADPRPVDTDLNQFGILLRLISFLRENFAAINQVFSSSEMVETERRLKSIEMQRARRIFPPEFFWRIDQARENEK